MKRIFQIIGLMSLVALIGIIAIFGLYCRKGTESKPH
jgi:Tfp pilus assembly major pilin PilA